MDAHTDAKYHVHGQEHPANAGKPRALKGACVVWRGALGTGQQCTSPGAYPTQTVFGEHFERKSKEQEEEEDAL